MLTVVVLGGRQDLEALEVALLVMGQQAQGGQLQLVAVPLVETEPVGAAMEESLEDFQVVAQEVGMQAQFHPTMPRQERLVEMVK